MVTPRQQASTRSIARPGEQNFLGRLELFAREQIANHPALFHPQEFPSELFTAMGHQSLLGVNDITALAQGSYVISRGTGSLGFSIAWALQSLIPFVLSGQAELDESILTGLKSGAVIISLAISEPRVGANPKHLSTTADRVTGGWMLNGEKAYVTNGPLASHVAVMAISSIENGRKAFSTYLVPAGAPGFSAVEQSQLDALRPAQHCDFVLRDCFVPHSALVGRPGLALADIARPFRAIEDAVLSGALIGVLVRAAVLAASPELSPDQVSVFGGLAGIVEALEPLRLLLIDALLSGCVEDDPAAAQIVAVHDLTQRSVEILRSVSTEDMKDVTRILRDVEKYLGIASTARRARKERLGRSYFSSTG